MIGQNELGRLRKRFLNVIVLYLIRYLCYRERKMYNYLIIQRSGEYWDLLIRVGRY